MTADRDLTRRAVLAGLCGALALAFAPLDRFMAGLGRMLRSLLGLDSGEWTYTRSLRGEDFFEADGYTSFGPDAWRAFTEQCEQIMAKVYSDSTVYGHGEMALASKTVERRSPEMWRLGYRLIDG